MPILTRVRLIRLVSWAVYPAAVIFLYPLARMKRKNPSGLFFFFDRYGVGGAQSVFLDILRAVQGEYKQVYFTRKPMGAGRKQLFSDIPNTEIREIHFWTCNVFFRFFAVHYHAFYINRHKGARVLGSNSTFFHDMVPFLSDDVHKIDLFHNFQKFGNLGFEFFGLANCRYLDTRVVVDRFTLSKIRDQYAAYGIPSGFLDRVIMIEPAVRVPADFHKDYSPPLKVLYAGRGGPQKRVWLINEIAERLADERLPVEFHFAGSMLEELSERVQNGSIVYGEVANREKMREIYSRCHAVILTSGFEGFPMVVKEGMAAGCVPIVTALPGNKMHLTEGETALFIEAVDDEKKVVALGIERIRELAGDPGLLARLSEQAYRYARQNFGMDVFAEKYRKLLLR